VNRKQSSCTSYDVYVLCFFPKRALTSNESGRSRRELSFGRTSTLPVQHCRVRSRRPQIGPAWLLRSDASSFAAQRRARRSARPFPRGPQKILLFVLLALLAPLALLALLARGYHQVTACEPRAKRHSPTSAAAFRTTNVRASEATRPARGPSAASA
jgi:hypothetical protein